MNANCQMPQSRIDAYADGELDAREAQVVERHLEQCTTCLQIVTEHREIKELIREGFDHLIPSSNAKAGWETIAAQLDFRPSLWQKIRSVFARPLVWLPSSLVAASAAVFIFIVLSSSDKLPILVSQVESVSVSSPTEQVWVLQTAKSRQPLIWIQSGTPNVTEAG